MLMFIPFDLRLGPFFNCMVQTVAVSEGAPMLRQVGLILLILVPKEEQLFILSEWCEQYPLIHA